MVIKCSKCSAFKDITEFHRDNHGKFGVRSECKECTKLRDSNYRNLNQNVIKEKMKKWYAENQNKVKNYREKYYKTIEGTWANISSNKINGKHKFEISKEEFFNWYNSVPKLCDYCGYSYEDINKILILLGIKKKLRRLEIDRKDSTKGYSINNIVLACNICNYHKKNFYTYNEFKEIAHDYLKEKFEKILFEKS